MIALSRAISRCFWAMILFNIVGAFIGVVLILEATSVGRQLLELVQGRTTFQNL